MNPKTSFDMLLVQLVKVAIMLFSFLIFQVFLGMLPFVQSLTIGSSSVTALDLTGTVLAIMSVIIMLHFAARAESLIDELLPYIPKSGKLVKLIIITANIVFCYYAFQSVILPFIPGWEWAYSVLFLLGIIILLAIVGFQIYNTSEEISSFFVSLLQHKKDEKKPS